MYFETQKALSSIKNNLNELTSTAGGVTSMKS